MTKREFVKRYRSLTAAERKEITGYYIDLCMGARLGETFAEADKRLDWIREIERKENGGTKE